jgi:hypothetical protein
MKLETMVFCTGVLLALAGAATARAPAMTETVAIERLGLILNMGVALSGWVLVGGQRPPAGRKGWSVAIPLNRISEEDPCVATVPLRERRADQRSTRCGKPLPHAERHHRRHLLTRI